MNLKEACVGYFKTRISVETAGDLLIVAVRSNAVSLKAAVLAFVSGSPQQQHAFSRTARFDRVRLYSKDLMTKVYLRAVPPASQLPNEPNIKQEPHCL